MLLAADLGHIDCVALLLKHGANSNLANNHGVKPIDAAKSNEIKLLLLQNSQECAICCNVKTNLLACIHCKQPLCKECAQKWIGINFTFDTHYYEDPNWFSQFEVHNDSCPYCRQTITQNELQQMIDRAGQNEK